MTVRNVEGICHVSKDFAILPILVFFNHFHYEGGHFLDHIIYCSSASDSSAVECSVEYDVVCFITSIREHYLVC